MNVCVHPCMSVCVFIFESVGMLVCVCVLTVEAEVLGEGLGAEQLKALRHKVADGPGILVQAARRKALIGRVKEHKQTPPLRGERGGGEEERRIEGRIREEREEDRRED